MERLEERFSIRFSSSEVAGGFGQAAVEFRDSGQGESEAIQRIPT
jgi:hypothetical protein